MSTPVNIPSVSDDPGMKSIDNAANIHDFLPPNVTLKELINSVRNHCVDFDGATLRESLNAFTFGLHLYIYGFDHSVDLIEVYRAKFPLEPLADAIEKAVTQFSHGVKIMTLNTADECQNHMFVFVENKDGSYTPIILVMIDLFVKKTSLDQILKDPDGHFVNKVSLKASTALVRERTWNRGLLSESAFFSPVQTELQNVLGNPKYIFVISRRTDRFVVVKCLDTTRFDELGNKKEIAYLVVFYEKAPAEKPADKGVKPTNPPEGPKIALTRDDYSVLDSNGLKVSEKVKSLILEHGFTAIQVVALMKAMPKGTPDRAQLIIDRKAAGMTYEEILEDLESLPQPAAN